VSIFEEQVRTYHILQEVLIAQNKTDDALEIAERGRARAFVELLARHNATTSDSVNSTITPPTIERLQQSPSSKMPPLLSIRLFMTTSRLRVKKKLTNQNSIFGSLSLPVKSPFAKPTSNSCGSNKIPLLPNSFPIAENLSVSEIAASQPLSMSQIAMSQPLSLSNYRPKHSNND
jgi:hypothetical protein